VEETDVTPPNSSVWELGNARRRLGAAMVTMTVAMVTMSKIAVSFTLV